jgi:ribosomal protein S18 acetylase RimI-like enzyme
MAQGSVEAGFVVVPAGPADAELLARAHVAAWRETYEGLIPEAYLARMSEAGHARRFARGLLHPGPDDVTLALTDRWRIVGYAQGGPSRRGAPGEAEVATLYLLRAVQGRGLGRRLLGDTARALAARGARSLVISVLRDNLPARRFYERLSGIAEPERREPGPGGGVYTEIAYRWPDITRLTD